MKKTINAIQDEIITELSQLNNWFDKYEYLINLGKTWKPTDKTLKTKKNTIQGCQSNTWLKAELKGYTIKYIADSDSLITKGMIALLLRVVNNQTPKDIIQAELYFLKKIGLISNLSPSRANGLMTIVNQIKTSAEKLHS